MRCRRVWGRTWRRKGASTPRTSPRLRPSSWPPSAPSSVRPLSSWLRALWSRMKENLTRSLESKWHLLSSHSLFTFDPDIRLRLTLNIKQIKNRRQIFENEWQKLSKKRKVNGLADWANVHYLCDVTYFHLEVSLEQTALLSLVRVGAAWTYISLSKILLSNIYFDNFS